MYKIAIAFLFVMGFVKVYKSIFSKKNKVIIKQKFSPPKKSDIQDGEFEDIK